MSQQELVIAVLKILEEQGIHYMVTGSIVSSIQGEPRSTHDIDIVVSIDKNNIDKLVNSFSAPDYYLDRDAVGQAVETNGMFNVIDMKGGDKVDFWVLTDDAFDRSRFSRAIYESFFGQRMRISTPEDTILMKLKWAKMSGGSEKQYKDALRVFEVQRYRMDLNYLQDWAKRLDIELLWERLKADAAPLN
jgi:hypothetical protein